MLVGLFSPCPLLSPEFYSTVLQGTKADYSRLRPTQKITILSGLLSFLPRKGFYISLSLLHPITNLFKKAIMLS